MGTNFNTQYIFCIRDTIFNTLLYLENNGYIDHCEFFKLKEQILYDLVEERINDFFLEYQIENGIESGDISPLQALRLEELQNELTDLVMNVGGMNMQSSKDKCVCSDYGAENQER